MSTSAKVIADSTFLTYSKENRIVTFELEFPRIILAEFNTHRVFSRNAASTRAIPLKNAIEYLITNTFNPTPFTKNKPGMSSNEPSDDQKGAELLWNKAMKGCIDSVLALHDLGVSKQHAGRLLESFSFIKVIVTSTEWDNFFELRNHEDAQPEIHELARVMKEAMDGSITNHLTAGEWHVPYYADGYWSADLTHERYAGDVPDACDNWAEDFNGFTLKDALMISASCCAQVSYRKLDESPKKAKMIYDRLITSRPMHASPFEHQATPIFSEDLNDWTAVDGITHIDKFGNHWSGNFRNWIQHRQLIEV